MRTNLDDAIAALWASRDVSRLMVCPGPRGEASQRPGEPRRLGRHLHWYIGEFQCRPGVSGPVRCEEAPTFKTEGAAGTFLARVVAACDCENYLQGLVSNECPVHNENPRQYDAASGRSAIVTPA